MREDSAADWKETLWVFEFPFCLGTLEMESGMVTPGIRLMNGRDVV